MEKNFYICLAGSINEELLKRLGVQAVHLEGGVFMLARMSTAEVECARTWPAERLESWSSPFLPYDELHNL